MHLACVVIIYHESHVDTLLVLQNEFVHVKLRVSELYSQRITVLKRLIRQVSSKPFGMPRSGLAGASTCPLNETKVFQELIPMRLCLSRTKTAQLCYRNTCFSPRKIRIRHSVFGSTNWHVLQYDLSNEQGLSCTK